MKSKNEQLISKIVSSQKFQEMFDELSANLARDDHQFKSIFHASMKMIQGYAFSTPAELNFKIRVVVEMVAKVFTAKQVDIKELSDVAFIAFVDCAQALNDDEEVSFHDFKKAYSIALEGKVESSFGYRTRCTLFSFEDDTSELKSKYVNVLRGKTLISWWKPFGKKYNTLPSVVPKANFELVPQAGEEDTKLTFPEIYWDIDCSSVSNNARIEASWMAGVFVSFVRLTLPQADYCHRPKLGQLEARFGESKIVNEGGVAYSGDSWSGFNLASYGSYKVDDKFLIAFESVETQGKLNSLFVAKKSSLAFRVANSLGWLARARQTKDFSERLLHNFTSLEALLSENSATAPVLETVSRSISIILAKSPNDRETIFKNVKRLYGLRSGLVHRGMRTANEIDSNDVEIIAENCVAKVLKVCKLDQYFDDFLADMKKATHGHPWPKLDSK